MLDPYFNFIDDTCSFWHLDYALQQIINRS
jgi:hypothetical protein